MRRCARALLLFPFVLTACQTTTNAEVVARQNGTYSLRNAGGDPLPFADVRGTDKSEMLSGSFTMNGTDDVGGTCGFTIAYRESSNGLVVDQGSETSSCTFYRVLGTLLRFQFAAVKTGRFQHHFVSGLIDETRGGIIIVVRDSAGVKFEFAK